VNGVSTFEGEITGMWLNGVAIEPGTSYSVTVNSFLASGGDNFRELANGTGKADTGKVDLQAMVDYLAEFAPEGDPLEIDYSQRAVEVENVASATSGWERRQRWSTAPQRHPSTATRCRSVSTS
jgi:5'-nucleotidase